MVSEVNKIISNTLLIKRSIQLPEIGSLYVERLPAQLTKEGKSILPTRYIVRFTRERAIGDSIASEIARIGGCSEEVAETIYSRWRESVEESGDIVIEGIGTIKQGDNFTYDKKINDRLNPTKPRSLSIKRQRRSTWIWIAASVVAAAVVGFVVLEFSGSWISSPQTAPTTAQVSQKATTEEVISNVDEPKVVDSLEPEAPQVEEHSVAPPTVEVTQMAESNARYRVVYGVFSISANIERAKQLINKYNPLIECRVYPYGKSELVSIFESNSVEECKSFIDANKELSEGLWIYKRK